MFFFLFFFLPDGRIPPFFSSLRRNSKGRFRPPPPRFFRFSSEGVEDFSASPFFWVVLSANGRRAPFSPPPFSFFFLFPAQDDAYRFCPSHFPRQLSEYLTELTFFCFFPSTNTPVHPGLVFSPCPFAVLASPFSPFYGIYNGCELCSPPLFSLYMRIQKCGIGTALSSLPSVFCSRSVSSVTIAPGTFPPPPFFSSFARGHSS